MNLFPALNGLRGMLCASLFAFHAAAAEDPPVAVTPPTAQSAATPAVPAPTQPEQAEQPAQTQASEPASPAFRFQNGWVHDQGGNGHDKVSVGVTGTLGASDSCQNYVVVLGKAVCDGHVERDAVIVSSDAEINGTIDGDLRLILSKAHIGSKAVIKGALIVVGPAPEIEPGAKIAMHGAEVTSPLLLGAADYVTQGLFWGRPFPPRVHWVWGVALALFAVAFLITLLFPRPVTHCANVLRERPFACFFAGVGFRILVPLLAILAGCTMILIPVIPFLFCIVLAGAFLGKAALCVVLGQILVGRSEEPSGPKLLAGFVLGAVLIYCLYMIPFLGLFAFLIVWPTILGAAMLSRFGVPRPKRLPAPTPAPRIPASPDSPSSPPVSPGPAPAMAEARASSTSGSSESGWAAPASSLAILHASVPDLGGGDPAQLPSGAPAATLPPKAGDGAATAGMPPLISRPADHRGSILEILACPRAGFFWRLAATILDLLAVWAVTHFLTRNDRYNPLASGRGFLTVWLAYHVGMWLWKGTTLGGSVFGLRCVRTNGAPLDWRVAFMRAFASCVSFLALGLGFFWVAWDPEKQSWHDKIADTMIVKMPRAIALV